MYDASLPWQIALILNTLGFIGSVIFANIAIDRLIEEEKEKKNQENKRVILLASIALGFIFTVFTVPYWYRAYIQGGSSLLIALVSFAAVPLFGMAIDRKRGFMIASYSLAGIYMLVSIATIIIAVIKG